MDVKVNIPFNQLLALIHRLNAKQKAQLRAELDSTTSQESEALEFIRLISNGPVYVASDLQQIENNRESIRQWRHKP
jgi:hypothetical protein